MSDRDVRWLDLYRTADARANIHREQLDEFAYDLMLGETFRLLGARCTATITWIDPPPMTEEQMRDMAIKGLAALRERQATERKSA